MGRPGRGGGAPAERRRRDEDRYSQQPMDSHAGVTWAVTAEQEKLAANEDARAWAVWEAG